MLYNHINNDVIVYSTNHHQRQKQTAVLSLNQGRVLVRRREKERERKYQVRSLPILTVS